MPVLAFINLDHQDADAIELWAERWNDHPEPFICTRPPKSPTPKSASALK